MATRTEQADLELALYSGHGEFSRAIYAPGSIESAFSLTQEAFRVALKYQTPAIVLTDQYFVNSFYNVRPDDLFFSEPPSHVLETGEGYRRYEETASGCSPFGVPGWGSGIVGADSHEHDEVGHVYENFKLRKRMQEKRMRKLEGMREEALAPKLYGAEEFTDLVLCWGSTIPIFKEALTLLDLKETALLAFEQVWPLHSSVDALLKRARRIVAAEGNSTAQFSRLLRAQTGVAATDTVLKYNGLQFSVEEAARRLSEVFSGTGGRS
jgi:2-oxoglutarate ferredoxin oxidoreductase subunit alpha